MFSLHKFHTNISINYDSYESLIIKESLFPKEKFGIVKDASGIKIASILYEKILFEGGYGILQKGKRIVDGGASQTIMIKMPKMEMNLVPEALIQWYAWMTLEKYGLQSAIPEIYDIFQAADMRFSMEYILGEFPYELLAKTATPDVCFFQILAQVCILLYILEKDISLDHRDLKANNLYIRKRPIDYTFTIGDTEYRIKAPFQVIILDFGFACIGTKINLAQGILPEKDPCPKEGRDLFHLLTSFWSIPSIRDRMSTETQKEIDGSLLSYARYTKKFTDTNWVYVVTSDPAFVYPELAPAALLPIIYKHIS
jgi:serine/threonine protein kinase